MNPPRVRELETKLSFLERHVEEQDRVILAIQERLDRFTKELAEAKERLDLMGREGSEATEPDRPPHH